MSGRPVVLTIAGTDSGGGAGVVADTKAFEAHGVWGAVAVTAVTAQNTLGLSALTLVDASMVYGQIRAVAVDLGIDAAKSGMLGSAAVLDAVVRGVRDFGVGPLVVDPVLVATTGQALTTEDMLAGFRSELLPLAALTTPNLAEASALVGGWVETKYDVEKAARELLALGPAAVLITGGHLAGAPDDCLAVRGEDQVVWLKGRRVDTPTTHGTGCVLSAAIASRLALGQDLERACRGGKAFVSDALAAGTALGTGAGAVDPGAAGRSV